jgi:hypothetical protein
VVVGVADAVALAHVAVEIEAAAAAVAVEAFVETVVVVVVVVAAAEEFADVVVVEGLTLDPSLHALAEGMLEALIAYVNP